MSKTEKNARIKRETRREERREVNKVAKQPTYHCLRGGACSCKNLAQVAKCNNASVSNGR